VPVERTVFLQGGATASPVKGAGFMGNIRVVVVRGLLPLVLTVAAGAACSDGPKTNAPTQLLGPVVNRIESAQVALLPAALEAGVVLPPAPPPPVPEAGAGATLTPYAIAVSVPPSTSCDIYPKG
jgi:hypothetical protein